MKKWSLVEASIELKIFSTFSVFQLVVKIRVEKERKNLKKCTTTSLTAASFDSLNLLSLLKQASSQNYETLSSLCNPALLKLKIFLYEVIKKQQIQH